MRLGFGLTGAAALLTGAAAFVLPTPLRALTAAASVAVLAVAGLALRRQVGAVQLRVTPAAEVLMRADERAEPRLMQSLFVMPWLIVLGDRGGALQVWPDRLGAQEYRRLAVACRWGRLAEKT
jgi:hypothetical protein